MVNSEKQHNNAYIAKLIVYYLFTVFLNIWKFEAIIIKKNKNQANAKTPKKLRELKKASL